MNKRNRVRRAFVCALSLAASLSAASAGRLTARVESSPGGKLVKAAASAQDGRVDIRLRSLTTRATGKLTVEPSEGGGRARLTALNLPDPQTVVAGAATYVVWAVSGGRIVRLGELRRDERGNGGLAFDSPAGFDRYGVIVTAEAGADVERPGDPVLTTRADEAAALFPPKSDDGAGKTVDASSVPVPAMGAASRTRRFAGSFYAEVDDALASKGGGRVIELEGDTAAPSARGAARATLSSNRAYVRANFRGVPLPSSVGAGVYVLWAVVPDGRIVYMGSLPADEAVNTAEVYVRVAGFDTDDYTLFVTAEQSRPAASPSGRRALTPKGGGLVVK
jgi:hypothetical protein